MNTFCVGTRKNEAFSIVQYKSCSVQKDTPKAFLNRSVLTFSFSERQPKALREANINASFNNRADITGFNRLALKVSLSKRLTAFHYWAKLILASPK